MDVRFEWHQVGGDGLDRMGWDGMATGIEWGWGIIES